MNSFPETNYYSNGGAGGGGYVTGSSPFGSGGGSPGGFSRKNEMAHSLRPVSICQLLSAAQSQSDDWTLDDNVLGQVTVVAQVVTIQNQATNSMYWLDDGTGRIEARHWVDSSVDDDLQASKGITEGVYVRALGAIKIFGNKRYINATHIRGVQSDHELYCHLLECMAVSLMCERGPPPGQSLNVDNMLASGARASTSDYTAKSSAAAAMDQYAHLPPLHRQIIQVILNNASQDEGVNVGLIAHQIGDDPAELSRALDDLMDQGHIYTTINDSHFNVAN